MDNASLITTIAARLNRGDLAALIPDFIARAEDEIFARLAADPVRPMQTLTAQDITTQSWGLPSNFIDAIDLAATVGDDTWKMVRLGLEDDADYYATRALPYRTPYDASKIRHYWVIGSTAYLPAAPSSTMTMTLRYYAKPSRLADVGSNWVIANHADVYEFGSLMHAARHLRDDEFEDRMADKFATALGLMIDAYPERQNPSELRASDMPGIYPRWNVLNG